MSGELHVSLPLPPAAEAAASRSCSGYGSLFGRPSNRRILLLRRRAVASNRLAKQCLEAPLQQALQSRPPRTPAARIRPQIAPRRHVARIRSASSQSPGVTLREAAPVESARVIGAVTRVFSKDGLFSHEMSLPAASKRIARVRSEPGSESSGLSMPWRHAVATAAETTTSSSGRILMLEPAD